MQFIKQQVSTRFGRAKEDWEACGYQYSENINENTITLSREPVRRFLDIDDSYEIVHNELEDEILVFNRN